MFYLRLLVAIAFVVSSFFATTKVQAQEQAGLGETSVVVPANGTTSLTFFTYCLEQNKDFPARLTTPNGRASEAVIKVLKAAIEEGLAESDPLQTQLAIWHEVEGDWPFAEDVVKRDVAQSLLDKAATVSMAPLEPEGIPLDQAIANGTVTATSEDFTSLPTPHVLADGQPYHGRGTLRIQNNTAQDVTVYFPFGLFFESTDETVQDMVAYATELEQEEPQVTSQSSTQTQSTPTSDPGTTSAQSSTVTQQPQTLPQTGAATPVTTLPTLLLLVGAVLLSGGLIVKRWW